MKRHIRRAQPEFESRAALRRNYSARFLNDARIRYEITNGLTDFGASAKQLGRSRCCLIWHLQFAADINEVTLQSRPASSIRYCTVETDHPHVEFSNTSYEAQ